MNLKQLLESVDESKIIKFKGGSGLLFVWTCDDDGDEAGGQGATERSVAKSDTDDELLAGLPELLSIDEVASVLRVGKSSVYELVRRKELPHFRMGRMIRIPKKKLAEWIENGGDS